MWRMLEILYNNNNVSISIIYKVKTSQHLIKTILIKCMKLFHTRHEGEMQGQPPSHLVTGRMQGHSLHQMQRSWACVSQWTGILPLSQSLWALKREGKGAVEGSGVPCEGGICGVLCMRGEMCCKVWNMECCEVWDMQSAVWCGITCGTWQSKH